MDGVERTLINFALQILTCMNGVRTPTNARIAFARRMQTIVEIRKAIAYKLWLALMSPSS